MKREIRFSEIKPHRGRRETGFEEMACQLFAREYAARGRVVRREGSGGDSGLESFVENARGEIIAGLQAKWFWEKLTGSHWNKIDDSICTALRDNAQQAALLEMVIAVPRDLNAAQRKTFNAWCAQWRTLAMELGWKKAPKFVWWGASELMDRLLKPECGGMRGYWFEFPDFTRERCGELTHAAILQLGDRYIAQLHTRTEAESVLHAFLRTETFRRKFIEAAQEAVGGWSEAEREDSESWDTPTKQALSAARQARKRALHTLGDGVVLPRTLASVAAAWEQFERKARHVAAALRDLSVRESGRAANPAYGEESLDEQARTADQCCRSQRAFVEFLESHSHSDAQCLLLSGEAGSGKSHLLAEIASGYSREGGVVLFRDARHFAAGAALWRQFIDWTDFPGGVRDFLATLEAMAEPTGLSALICLDALNEPPGREVWARELQAFAAELAPYRGIKLLVSCRSDYLAQTIPAVIREGQDERWALAEHQGLGVNYLEALPKYLAEYDVRGVGIPPLTREFQNPLFIKTFCEAFSGKKPSGCRFTLTGILDAYASRKAQNIAKAIDCSTARVRTVFQRLAEAMHAKGSAVISESAAREITETVFPVVKESDSLYRALVSEGVVMELAPSTEDAAEGEVRFTFERVWDYFVAEDYARAADPTRLRGLLEEEEEWCEDNVGVVEMLALLLPARGLGELLDLAPQGEQRYAVREAFLRAIPWRSAETSTTRTWELFDSLVPLREPFTALPALLGLVPNPSHPRNADWLDAWLRELPMCDRDQTWTHLVNNQLYLHLHQSEANELGELLTWAEKVRTDLLSDEQTRLLATALAWCLTSSCRKGRDRVSYALIRLLRSRRALTVRWVERFLDVEEPYVRERVLFVAAGVAMSAPEGDPSLAALCRCVHSRVFAGDHVQPHLLARHYAREVCEQALAKDALPSDISPASFRPPYRSRWPKIWSSARVDKLDVDHHLYRRDQGLSDVLSSTRTEQMGSYGRWGRYVMGSVVHRFQDRRRRQTPVGPGARYFDDRIARRYVIQRLHEFGWRPGMKDTMLDTPYESFHRPALERLTKKYQWIALQEFLGYLSDHFHLRAEFREKQPRRFESANQISPPDLLDPFVVEAAPDETRSVLRFTPEPARWWMNYPHPFPRPTANAQAQRRLAIEVALPEPVSLLQPARGDADWLLLDGCIVWREPTNALHPRRDGLHVELSWLVSSFLVPNHSLPRFLTAVSKTELDGYCVPKEPTFEAGAYALNHYPAKCEELAEWCEPNFAEGLGAVFTACEFQNEQEESNAVRGLIPSPQLADHAGLRWSRRELAFTDSAAERDIVCFLKHRQSEACVAERATMVRILRSKRLNLVWRLYGWKVLHGEPSNECHQREYWATYTMDSSGKIVCRDALTCRVNFGREGWAKPAWSVVAAGI